VSGSEENQPELADQFEAKLHWLNAAEMLPGRSYILKTANSTITATVTRLKYKVETKNNLRIASSTLRANETGVCNISLSLPIAFDSFESGGTKGSFTLLDISSGTQVADGKIHHGLRRASNVHWQAMAVDKQARSALKQQRPCVLWLTGLSAAGKSTIANLVEKKLIADSKHSYLLDGDNVRHGLNRDLGFTDADRVENIRRIAETAKLMVDAGLIVITSFISPFRSERDTARGLFEPAEFIEVFIDTSLEACEERDPKGLYKKARLGEIKNFTGFDSPYEEPENPELHIDTSSKSAEQAADEIIAYLSSEGASS
jgi:bifunctional enzyme CysN/CysC